MKLDLDCYGIALWLKFKGKTSFKYQAILLGVAAFVTFCQFMIAIHLIENA